MKQPHGRMSTERFFHKKFSKIVTLVQKKKNHYPPRWIFMTHTLFPHTIPWGYYNFPRGTNNIQFFDIISTSGKIVDLMKDLKYEHQSTFPCKGGSNLILGTGTENQIFILRT